jgi:hypothetical protein
LELQRALSDAEARAAEGEAAARGARRELGRAQQEVGVVGVFVGVGGGGGLMRGLG